MENKVITKKFHVRVKRFDYVYTNEMWTIIQGFSIGDVLVIENEGLRVQIAPVYMKEVIKALETGWNIYVEDSYGLGDVECVYNLDIRLLGDKWTFDGFDATISDAKCN